MAINYPASLDAITNPTDTTRRNDPGHELHAVIGRLNDIAEALELKLGIGVGAPTTVGDVLHVTGAGETTYGPRALVRLSETILSVAAAGITFSSIPATYRHLMVEWICRDNAGGGTGISAVLLTLGSGTLDIGANYDYQIQAGSGATSSSSETLAQTAMRVGSSPMSAAGSLLFGNGTIWIHRYAGTAHQKVVTAQAGVKWANAANSMAANSIAGFWRNDSIITTIGLVTAGGNMAAGAMATLYGVPA